jgi:hypothetical protein
MRWTSGINATTFTVEAKAAVVPLPEYETVNNDGKTLWTGGFTNRLQIKNFSFGLDMIYFLNEVRQVASYTRKKFNNWRINHVYGAYQLKVKGRPLEVYISSSNTLQNKNSFFINDRQYYGAGFKLQL